MFLQIGGDAPVYRTRPGATGSPWAKSSQAFRLNAVKDWRALFDGMKPVQAEYTCESGWGAILRMSSRFGPDARMHDLPP